MSGNSCRGLQIIRGFLTVAFCAHLSAVTPTAWADGVQADSQTPLPVTAQELMPLEPSRGVYFVVEGSEIGKAVPFTFEQRGDQWILTKDGMAQHELHRDHQGNLLIDRETDLREGWEIEYTAPITLLPATIDSHTSMTGTTRVIVRNIRTRSVKYRGVCRWQLDFVGAGSVERSGGTLPTYRLRATREIRLALAQISMTTDFEYARGTGMVATGINQVIHSLSLFTERDQWRLVQSL